MKTTNCLQCYYPDPRLPVRVIPHRGTFTHDAYPVHIHEDVSWEFCYSIRGQVTAVVRGVPRHVTPGEVLILGPHDVHGFDAWTGKHITLMFQQKVLRQTPLTVRSRRLSGLELGGMVLPQRLKIAPQRRPLVEHTLEQIRREEDNDHPMRETMAVLLLSQLLLELMRSAHDTGAPDELQISPAARETIEQFCGELRGNLDYPWTLSEMVRRSGYGASQLSRLFREVTSLSPCAWLTEERVRRARDLLTQSDMKVTEIAVEVGFGSCCHFTRVFNSVMGTSPREYREAMRLRQ